MAYRPQAVTIDNCAVDHLVEFCRTNYLTKLFLVADKNTFAAQGKAAQEALLAAGFDLKSTVFTGEEVIADAAHVLDVLIAAGSDVRTYIAVGSGTLTDITRFASHRTHSQFISMPTAPSVDGFASIGAPLIVHGVKITVICQAPLALFADINTLANAPQAMIAAGFADMLGKLTSIADWRIGRLLWNEPYDETIAQRTLDAVQICVDNADAIGQGAWRASAGCWMRCSNRATACWTLAAPGQPRAPSIIIRTTGR
ncbi:MAG: iron-containing alcohol dehydrogenase [Anaerolineales bacterium]|nr:iron-containing alcohol dehydrogenase [Anaerolineales bacterium]